MILTSLFFGRVNNLLLLHFELLHYIMDFYNINFKLYFFRPFCKRKDMRVKLYFKFFN